MILKANENHEFKREIASLKHRKDSHNSSMPPSSDIVRERHSNSLRKSYGKKPGGQSGYKGSTLKNDWFFRPYRKTIPFSL